MNMKNFSKTLAVLLVMLAAAMPVKAEVFTSTYETTQCLDYKLLTEMLIGPGVSLHPCGVKIPQTSSVQIGVFSNLTARVIPSFTNGVILSTGKITDGPSLTNQSAIFEWPDDALPDLGYDLDLNTYFAEELSDPAGLVLYIQPKNKTINIPFVMASEEFYYDLWPAVDYPTLEGYEQYSDKFAFFLKELGDASDPAAYDSSGNVIDDGSLMTVNIAQLPGGGDVEIASVNQHVNTEYFIPNVVADRDGNLNFPANDLLLPMEFNGAIVGPVVVANNLDTNKIYKLKLIVGDSRDNTINSAVFLRERGITSGADLKLDVDGPETLPTAGMATFTNTVSNIGPAPADEVKVTHYLPLGVDKSTVSISCGVGSVDPASWGEVGGTNYFVWAIGDGFKSGSNAVMTVSCELPAAGSYTNFAQVVTSTGDYDPSNNTNDCVTVVGELPKLRVEAIVTNKVYGAELALSDLQFVLSIEGTNGTQVATGIDVAFTNALGEVANPLVPNATVGTYGIILSNIRGTDFSVFGDRITYVSGMLTIEKAAITVTANDATKVYGETKTFAGTEFAVTSGALVTGDSITSVTLASDGVPASAPYKPEGYPITPSNAVGTGLENYDISYADGTLTLSKRPISVKATDVTKGYGEEKTFAGTEFTITSGTLVDGDSITSVTLVSDGVSANAPYKVEGYPITPSNAVGTGLENYAITYVDGLLTITKRPITVKANDATKEYGETKSFAGTEYTIASGTLFAGDSITSVAFASDGAPASASYKVEGYPITPSNAVGTGLDNYAITYADGTLSLTKRAITITANDATKQYGETKTFAGTEFTVTAGILAAGDSVTSVTLASDGAPASAPYRAEGYPITPSNAVGTGLANYEITYANGTLSLTKRAITITANDATKQYGETKTFAGTEFTVTAGALAAGDSVTSVTLASDGAPAAAPYKPEGYPITPSNAVGTGLDNYAITYADGTLSLTKRAITITANDATKQYGETKTFAGTEFSVTSGTLAAGDSVTSVTLASDGAPASAPYKPEGYPITPSNAVGTGLDNYEITYAGGTLSIVKLAITITANDATKRYGEQKTFAGTEYTVSSGTLLPGDAVTSVTLVSDGAAANAAYRAEGYPIVPSAAVGTGLGNYEITYAPGTLTFAKRVITITANDATKQFGEVKTFAGTEFTITSGSLLAGDSITAVTLASDGAAANAEFRAEGYPIVASNAQGVGLENYDIMYAPGTLRIVKRPITITADDAIKEYGEELVFVGTEFKITSGSLAAGDAVDSVTLTSDGAVSNAVYKAEGYPIVASAAVGRGLDNYDITYSEGTLTIAKRAITLKANDATKQYGEELTFVGTEFTVATGTLVGDDKVDSVTLTCDGAAAGASYKAEGYPITPSAAVGTGLDNYDITYENGTLTITRLTLEITARNRQKPYGQPLAFMGREFVVTGGSLLAGDTVDSVTLTSDGAAAAAPYKPEGYPIVASNARGTGIENYEITYVDGTLTILKRALQITANDGVKAYGEELVFKGTEFSITDGSLFGDDAVTSVTLASDGAPATAPCRAEGYPITPSAAVGKGLENYEITYVDGTLTITKRAITVTANDATKAYGTELVFEGTEFRITAGTLAAGDSVTSVTLASDGAPATAPYRTEGYPITPSNAVGKGLENYVIAYADGTLSITKRAITVTANDATKAYGTELVFAGTEFRITAGTLAAGDSVTSVTLASDGAPATAPYRAEGYPITPSNAVGNGLENYTIAYAEGTLTITKLAIAITANDATKEYGEAKTFAGTEFTVSSGELLAGDSVESVSLMSDGSAASAPYKAEGYAIVPSNAQGRGLENYEITYLNGTLSITKRAISIKANDARKRDGEELVFKGTEFSIAAGALVAGDSVTSVTLVCDGAAAGSAYRAEGYPIVASNAVGTGLEGYAITYVPGTLTILKRMITIKANDARKTYGEEWVTEGTEFTISSGELQAGDSVDSVTLVSEGAASNAVCKVEGYPIVASAAVGTGLEKYEIVYENGTLMVDPVELTISVDNATWRVGNPRPDNKFADFSDQLKPGDTMADVIGGEGLASDVVYTNVVWNTAEPKDSDAGTYVNEIWVDVASIDGPKAVNYLITVDPGDLEITKVGHGRAYPLAKLKVAISAMLNRDTGLLDMELDIQNDGTGPIDPAYDYWVELKPGDAAVGEKTSVAKSYYLASPTGTMPTGHDYVDISSAVKSALKSIGNRDEVFDAGEVVKVKGVSVYHWKRWSPELFIDADAFVVAGRLFCEADTNRDFVVSEAEKIAASSLLGESSMEYLEVSRLALLEFYHWDPQTGTWK